MKRFIAGHVVLFGLLLSANTAFASNGGASLYDWCFNVNSDISACNDGGTTSVSGFDNTLETVGTNSLGTASFLLGPGSNQFVSFYADYDIDFAQFGSFDDFASVHGSLPTGWSYMLADPNDQTLFGIFAANTLDNSNSVSTPSEPKFNCCDVASALSISGINVAAGGEATVTFSVSSFSPEVGFYLQQTNANTQNSIYISASVNVQNPEGPVVPEPSTFMLGAGAVGIMLLTGKRLQRSRSAVN
jgi:hypothetical protein